jgi:hypothetical protein
MCVDRLAQGSTAGAVKRLNMRACETPLQTLERQAGTAERIKALNVENKPDASDGFVRGSILPLGHKQSALSYVTAVLTLALFISWPYFVALLAISSAFSSPNSCCIAARAVDVESAVRTASKKAALVMYYDLALHAKSDERNVFGADDVRSAHRSAHRIASRPRYAGQ